jgi:hypothetical protein
MTADLDAPRLYNVTRNGLTVPTYLTATRADVHRNSGRLVVPVEESA